MNSEKVQPELKKKGLKDSARLPRRPVRNGSQGKVLGDFPSSTEGEGEKLSSFSRRGLTSLPGPTHHIRASTRRAPRDKKKIAVH